MTFSVILPEFMRAARLLRILLILQNRGRTSAGLLAAELEVSRRTVLRDVDALTEAGLPVVAYPGKGGGIELAFDYRTRLTGLDAEEAEAMGVLLASPPQALSDLGLGAAAFRATAKVWEAFPDQTRETMAASGDRFPAADAVGPPDPRRVALARAVREGRIIRLQATGAAPRAVHPVALRLHREGWALIDIHGEVFQEADWGDVNISARRFSRSETVSKNPA